VDGIPDELKALEQWLAWRYEWRNDKWTKPPIDVNKPVSMMTVTTHASATDPSTWCPFEKAVTFASYGLDWIGFVLIADGSITAIDLPTCRLHPSDREKKWRTIE